MTAARQEGTTPDPAERKARASQSFWTLVVGIPAIFSVLRLGVEAGGELQTTLLLVANVGPVNLIAGLFTTAARLVSTGLVAVFAIGAVLSVSAAHAPPGWTGQRRPIFTRLTGITPTWFVVASFGVALATWQILYLPLLLPACAAAFQLSPVRLHEWVIVRVLLIAALLGAYGWLVLPTLYDAWTQRENFALVVAHRAAPAGALRRRADPGGRHSSTGGGGAGRRTGHAGLGGGTDDHHTGAAADRNHHSRTALGRRRTSVAM